MGMSREEKNLYAQLTAALSRMQNPESNQAQNYLTQNAIAGADWLKKGDFSSLPKGMFFNFQMPNEQLANYKKAASVNQGGTFALAGNDMNGRSRATSVQGKYLQDRFARDAAQNFQSNISNAAGNIQGALGQAAGATAQNQAGVIQALQGTMGLGQFNRPSIWGSVLGAAGGLGAAAMRAF